MSQADVYRMIRRRAEEAGIRTKIGCHTFRATGITEYLRKGGTSWIVRSFDPPFRFRLTHTNQFKIPSGGSWPSIMWVINSKRQRYDDHGLGRPSGQFRDWISRQPSL